VQLSVPMCYKYSRGRQNFRAYRLLILAGRGGALKRSPESTTLAEPACEVIECCRDARRRRGEGKGVKGRLDGILVVTVRPAYDRDHKLGET
jgi:hypothetical protein